MAVMRDTSKLTWVAALAFALGACGGDDDGGSSGGGAGASGTGGSGGASTGGSGGTSTGGSGGTNTGGSGGASTGGSGGASTGGSGGASTGGSGGASTGGSGGASTGGSGGVSMGGSGGASTGGSGGANTGGSGGAAGSLCPTGLSGTNIGTLEPAGTILDWSGIQLRAANGAVSVSTPITGAVISGGGPDDADHQIGSIYDLGPHGTTFPPVKPGSGLPMVVLPAPDASIPAGRVPVIMRYDTGLCQWHPLATIHVKELQVAITTLERIDRLAVVTLPEPADCDTYSACGGNVVGDWATTTFCDPDSMPQDEFLFCKSAPGSSTMTGVVLVAALVTFNSNNRFFWDVSSGFRYTTTMRPGCTSIIEKAVPGSTSSCSHMGDALALVGFSVGVCHGDVAVECICEGGGPRPSQPPIEGVFQTNADQITLTEDGSPPDSPEPYCQSGSELRMGVGEDMVVLAR